MSGENKVVFARDGSIVSIHIHCADVPAALHLYRRLCEEAPRDGATIDFKPRTEP